MFEVLVRIGIGARTPSESAQRPTRLFRILRGHHDRIGAHGLLRPNLRGGHAIGAPGQGRKPDTGGAQVAIRPTPAFSHQT